jgi:hypothetical protein
VSRFPLLSDGFRVRRCVIDKKDKKDRKIGDKPFPSLRGPRCQKRGSLFFFKNTFSRFLYLFYLFYLRANTPLKPRHSPLKNKGPPIFLSVLSSGSGTAKKAENRAILFQRSRYNPLTVPAPFLCGPIPGYTEPSIFPKAGFPMSLAWVQHPPADSRKYRRRRGHRASSRCASRATARACSWTPPRRAETPSGVCATSSWWLTPPRALDLLRFGFFPANDG